MLEGGADKALHATDQAPPVFAFSCPNTLCRAVVTCYTDLRCVAPTTPPVASADAASTAAGAAASACKADTNKDESVNVQDLMEVLTTVIRLPTSHLG